MTKKDYELIADELRLELFKYREHQNEPAYRALWELTHRLVVTFKQTNPKFNRSKFLQACGVEG